MMNEIEENRIRELEARIRELENQVRELQETSITWCVEDFEAHAALIEEEANAQIGSIYDRSKFAQALRDMIHNHDACYGVCWADVDAWLDHHCKK